VTRTYSLGGESLREVGNGPPFCEERHFHCNELALGVGGKGLDHGVVDTLNKDLEILVNRQQPSN
jgi:hypothetical protein